MLTLIVFSLIGFFSALCKWKICFPVRDLGAAITVFYTAWNILLGDDFVATGDRVIISGIPMCFWIAGRFVKIFTAKKPADWTVQNGLASLNITLNQNRALQEQKPQEPRNPGNRPEHSLTILSLK